MNERIRELAKQTDIWCDQNWHNQSTYDLAWEDKFAELIVKECIVKYDEWGEESSDQTSFRMARHNVKKHFGVEP